MRSPGCGKNNMTSFDYAERNGTKITMAQKVDRFSGCIAYCKGWMYSEVVPRGEEHFLLHSVSVFVTAVLEL